MRLARYLAHAGVASRRSAERIVAAGRVAVAGAVVTDPARDVDEHSGVTLDGQPVAPERHEVHMLHKPAGVVSTARDTHGRPTVIGLVPSEHRLYPVGRLDADSTGLVLLTNDGEFANRLTHPRYGVEKVYCAEVSPRPVGEAALRALRHGVELDDGPTLPARVRQPRPGVLEVALREGRKRQLRRMCEAIGHRVVALRRVAFGPLALGDLPEGTSRRLGEAEVERLREATAGGEARLAAGAHLAVSARPRPEDGERDRILARAKRYPYAAPDTSYAITPAGLYELVGLGAEQPGTGLVTSTRARHAESGEELPFAALPVDDLDPGSLRTRLPVLAYGANRTAEALERKRGLPGFPGEESILVLRARLHDLDVVYSAHVSPYGSVGATLQRSPGTAVEVCVTLLTERQLAALGETEINYTLVKLAHLELELEGGGRLDRACSYVSRHGGLVLDGAQVALAAIPATGRRLEARTEAEILAAVARRLGHPGDLDDFILAAVHDPRLAAAHTRELRRDARPLDWPPRRPAR